MFVCWRDNARITQRGAWEMSNCVLWAIYVTVGPSDEHFGSVRNNLVASVCATSSLCPGSRVIRSWNLWLNRYNSWTALHLSVLSAPPWSETQVILCPLRCRIRKARNTSTMYLTYLGPHPVIQALSHHLIWLGEIYSTSFYHSVWMNHLLSSDVCRHTLSTVFWIIDSSCSHCSLVLLVMFYQHQVSQSLCLGICVTAICKDPGSVGETESPVVFKVQVHLQFCLFSVPPLYQS
jgi:hypothetical protein